MKSIKRNIITSRRASKNKRVVSVDPLGELTALPRPLAGLEGKGGKRGEERDGRERRGYGRRISRE